MQCSMAVGRYILGFYLSTTLLVKTGARIRDDVQSLRTPELSSFLLL